MTRKTLRSFPLVAALIVSLAALPQPALAGPPLICHPIEIGSAKSLPWAGKEWRDVKRDYDVNHLVADTLALLAPDTPVLVRMETLRRATIYAVWAQRDREVGLVSKNDKVADELLARLMDRTREAFRNNQPAGLALFDAGYLASCYRQAGHATPNVPDGFHMTRKAGGAGINSPEMEFAMALMTEFPKQPGHREHLQKAIAGAQEGSLLARNLVKHFGKPGQNLAALRAQVASAAN